MNWLKSIIVSIAAIASSLFGMHKTAPQIATSTYSGSSSVVSESVDLNSDNQNITSVVVDMLDASRAVRNFQDVENVLYKYSPSSMLGQLAARLGNLPSQIQMALVEADRSYPDPNNLRFSIVVNGMNATATAAVPESVSSTMTHAGNFTADIKSDLVISLIKEGNDWKVSKITSSSTGMGQTSR